jgi:hypothetical protein
MSESKYKYKIIKRKKGFPLVFTNVTVFELFYLKYLINHKLGARACCVLGSAVGSDEPEPGVVVDDLEAEGLVLDELGAHLVVFLVPELEVDENPVVGSSIFPLTFNDVKVVDFAEVELTEDGQDACLTDVGEDHGDAQGRLRSLQVLVARNTRAIKATHALDWGRAGRSVGSLCRLHVSEYLY